MQHDEADPQNGGGGNSATVTQSGNKGQLDLTSVGASNNFTVSQAGGATNGHVATLDFNGSSNNVSVTQQGTSADSIVNLKSVGSGNTFTINTNTQ